MLCDILVRKFGYQIGENMIYYLLDEQSIAMNVLAFATILITFFLTVIAIKAFEKILQRDMGRAFAVNGAKSAGKPRGAGIIFIITFTVSCLLFVPIKKEILVYIIVTFAAMLSGYLDDASDKPWGELKKGIIDLVIAIMLAVTFLNFNDNIIKIPFTDSTLTIPPVVFGILVVILVWASINVTNCSDGVDGLCGTLSIITLSSAYALCHIFNTDIYAKHMILIMIVCILAYLWFNASPSRLLMGDAGSRAIGIFIAIAMLKTTSPLLYLLVGLLLIIDGGLGLIKLTLIRLTKKQNIMKNLRTPIHDHMRKNKNWSDPQVVFRFAIIQTIISLATIMGQM